MEKCIHAGHRARLMDTVYNVRLDHLSEIQAVEFMLTYIFPRGDVNPLAHRLVERFGNVANIIDADINELKTIEGIGDRSAKAIIGLNILFDKVNDCRANQYEKLDNLDLICDYFEELLRFMTTENMFIVALDHKFRVIGKKRLTSGSVKNVGISPISIANFISSTKPAGILLAHNHPNGFCKPSSADLKATEFLIPVVENLGVTFLEHIIVGNDGMYGVQKGKMLRVF